MSAKELLLPIGLVVSILTSAVVISNSYGRNTQALLGVQSALTQLQQDVREGDQRDNETMRVLENIKARLQVLEKGADTRDAIDKRFLAHLERRGD